jgi:hypothetical protein
VAPVASNLPGSNDRCKSCVCVCVCVCVCGACIAMILRHHGLPEDSPELLLGCGVWLGISHEISDTVPLAKTHACKHIECPLLLQDFNKNWKSSMSYCKTAKY